MSKLGTIIVFTFGASVGGLITWYILKDQYDQRFEQEFLSEKEAFLNREEKLKTTIENLEAELHGEDDVEVPQTVLSNSKVEEKVGITDFAKAKYQQYAPKVGQAKPAAEVEETETIQEDAPYVISPEEFGEAGYTQVSLTYYADGILSDEECIIIDNVEEIVGDALDHFGEYEEDSVFCRSDLKKCDYEILKDLRRYADVRKSFPPNI